MLEGKAFFRTNQRERRTRRLEEKGRTNEIDGVWQVRFRKSCSFGFFLQILKLSLVKHDRSVLWRNAVWKSMDRENCWSNCIMAIVWVRLINTIAQALIGEGCSVRLNSFSCISNRRKGSVFESFFICFRLITITLFRFVSFREKWNRVAINKI